jgi:NTE family protein
VPYLGQQDHELPWLPPDLVRREEVADYPTDFEAMPATTIELLTRRGEQVTRSLLDAHTPRAVSHGRRQDRLPTTVPARWIH